MNLSECNRCELRKTCKGPVPGEGPQPSIVMLIGEAPGKEEDQAARPFVGNSGKLLNSMLAGIGLAREDVFITNTVKCKPVTGGVSKFVDDCREWLTMDLLLTNPKVVVLMGATSIHTILGNIGSVEHLHGKPVRIGERIYLPAYHPAATLYDTALLRQLFDDFSVLGKLIVGARVPPGS